MLAKSFLKHFQQPLQQKFDNSWFTKDSEVLIVRNSRIQQQEGNIHLTNSIFRHKAYELWVCVWRIN